MAAWWFGEPRLVVVLLVLAGVTVLGGFENVGIVEFRRAMRFDKQFLLLSVPRLVQVLVTIPLAFLLQSYWALLLGIALGKLVRIVATYVAHPYRPGLRLAGWRELAGFSFWTWATSTVNVVWERCDAVLLGPLLGPAGLGTYLLAGELAILPVTELISPAADALFTGFSAAQKQGPANADRAGGVAVGLLLLVVPLVIGISATSGYMIAALLGPKWQQAQPLVAIMAWQCVFAPFSYVCTTFLVAHGMVRLNFACNVSSATMRLGATVLVIAVFPTLHDMAIAMTSVVAAEGVVYFAVLLSVCGTKFPAMQGGLLRIALAGAVVVAALIGTGWGWQSVDMPPFAALIEGMGLGMAVIGSFGVVIGLQWWMAGSPPGPETLMLGLAGQFGVFRILRRKLGFT